MERPLLARLNLRNDGALVLVTAGDTRSGYRRLQGINFEASTPWPRLKLLQHSLSSPV